MYSLCDVRVQIILSCGIILKFSSKSVINSSNISFCINKNKLYSHYLNKVVQI